MATWQFDLHLLPRTRVVAASGAMPATITRAELDEEDWFADTAISPQIEDCVSRVLPESNSWSSQVRIWGQDVGHRIDLCYNGMRIASISVRISAQDDASDFLPMLVELCRRFDLVLVTETLDVFSPDLAQLQQIFRSSPAYRFVQAVGREDGLSSDWRLPDQGDSQDP